MNIRRILTPTEAMVMSGPAIQREIGRINSALMSGIRSFMVHTSLWPVISAELEAAGWVASDVHRHSIDVSFTLQPAPPTTEPSDDDVAAAYQAIVEAAPPLQPTEDRAEGDPQ